MCGFIWFGWLRRLWRGEGRVESKAPSDGVARFGIDTRERTKIEAEMYKTSAVLFFFLHLFIFFHLPQPTPTAAMSINERTYIMVKVRKP